MSIRALLKRAAEALATAGVPDPQVDAALLLGHVMALSRLQVLLSGDKEPSPDQRQAFDRLLARRLTREPLQYILGSAHFMGHEFLVRPGVLIPRADTEPLAQQALARLRPSHRALDLCTGTGAIAISLKLGCPEADVTASDLSPDALALARDNAARLKADIDLVQGDLLAPFAGQRFDLIACNPPYIPSLELVSLQEEVKREPRLALDGGADGLDLYRRLIAQAPQHLKPGGWLLLEMGDGQQQALEALIRLDFTSAQVYTDAGGLPRVLAACLSD